MSKTGEDPSRTFDGPDHAREECPECQRETPHAVSIEILEEGTGEGEGEAAYSREPYRVTVCEYCERREELRMNDQ
jgi:hypothetical protein